MFRWATSTGAKLGGAPVEDQERLGMFGELVGMAFQLVDDVLDYASESTHKTALADLRDGKMTLPLVFALERVPELDSPRSSHPPRRRRAARRNQAARRGEWGLR